MCRVYHDALITFPARAPSRNPEDRGSAWVRCIPGAHRQVGRRTRDHAATRFSARTDWSHNFTVTIGVNLNIAGLMHPQLSTTGVDALGFLFFSLKSLQQQRAETCSCRRDDTEYPRNHCCASFKRPQKLLEGSRIWLLR